jgi:hypothetical protein
LEKHFYILKHSAKAGSDKALASLEPEHKSPAPWRGF